MENARITKKNVSLASELKMLESAFPVEQLTEGRLIRYEELEGLLNQGRRTNRFVTIIGKWRNLLLATSGKVLLCRINEGYEVGNNSQRLVHAHSLQQQGVRRFEKSILVQDTVDTKLLTKEEREKFNHIRMCNNALEGFGFKRELQNPTI